MRLACFLIDFISFSCVKYNCILLFLFVYLVDRANKTDTRQKEGKNLTEIIVNVPEALSLQNIGWLETAEAQLLLTRIRSMAFLRSLLVAEKLLGTVNSIWRMAEPIS